MGPPSLTSDANHYCRRASGSETNVCLGEDAGCYLVWGCATGPHFLARSVLAASTFQKEKVRLQTFGIPNWSLKTLLMTKLGQTVISFTRTLLSLLTSHSFSLSILKPFMLAGKSWRPGRKASDLFRISHKPLVLKFGICSFQDQLKCGRKFLWALLPDPV